MSRNRAAIASPALLPGAAETVTWSAAIAVPPALPRKNNPAEPATSDGRVTDGWVSGAERSRHSGAEGLIAPVPSGGNQKMRIFLHASGTTREG